MRVVTAWQAMDQEPVRFLRTAWPWRAFAYLMSGVALGTVTLAVAVAVTATAPVAVLVVVDALIVVLLAASGGWIARLERRRLRLVDDDPTPDPHRAPLTPGLRARLRTRLRERVTWRELGFALLCATGLCVLDLAVLGFALGLPALCVWSAVADPSTWPGVFLGAVVLAGAPYTVTAWAGARATLTRTVLGPRDAELGADLGEVEPTPERLLDAFDAERARIERDMHDGAQQRLVALTMRLGLIRMSADDGSPLDMQLADAQNQLELALTELRELVRGLNPPLLAGYGLVAAIEDHVAGHPVPVSVDIVLPRRFPAAVERTVYFVVTEALANIVKHSGASAAAVSGRLRSDTLIVEIRDDGDGGAVPAAGSGLAGLAERSTLVGGRLRLSSPPGGPTLLRMEIPCRSA